MARALRLVAFLAVLYIGWNYGRPHFRAWRFRDAMTQQARLSGVTDREETRRSLLETAEELGVPIDPRRLSVDRDPPRGTISIAASWQEIVEIEGGPLGKWVDTLEFDYEASATEKDAR